MDEIKVIFYLPCFMLQGVLIIQAFALGTCYTWANWSD